MTAVSPSEASFAELVHETTETFQLHTDAYVSEPVYDAEIERIFERGWAFVSHESQVPAVGGFAALTLGRQPLVVMRDDGGTTRVFVNRCTACGHRVTWATSGLATDLGSPCPHDGDADAAAGRDLRPTEGTVEPAASTLQPVWRVGVYGGLIFVEVFRGDDLPFEEYLRPVRSYIDTWFDRSPLGTITLLPHPTRHEYPGNWKWQAENGNDTYHGNYVHESWQRVLQRSGEAPVRGVREYRNEGCTKGFLYGHGLIERPGGLNPNASWTGRMMQTYPEYSDALREKFDEAGIERLSTKLNIYIFPNLYLFDTHIRTITPITPGRTHVDLWVYALDGVPRALNEGRYRAHERFFGQAGFGTPDDIEIFVACETGLRARSVDWVLMSRGMHREERNGDETVGHSTDEPAVRALYREWRRRMAVDAGTTSAE